MPPSLLFDTQAVVFWATAKIPKPVIQRVSEGCRIYVSVVSPWEFILKDRTHSFGLNYAQFLNTVSALQANYLQVDLDHLQTLRALAFRDTHKDPFDRLIISQAIHERLILVGSDTEFYSVSGTSSLGTVNKFMRSTAWINPHQQEKR
jgi:PIN domain nuclease of toxin-antitoxin system